MAQTPFPDDFLWGASTAAHQVEGGLHNQWSEWERANAARLASTFTTRLSWLPHLQQIMSVGTDPKNYLSGNGVDHYTLYREDFALLQKLNMNAFRFGIEWARLEPVEGQWDEAAVAHYRRYIADLKARGIEPIPTLWHWTMPSWFSDKGGFEKRRNIAYFDRFVEKVAKEYGSELRQVLTLNEPNVYAAFSYFSGEWPPQRRNVIVGLRVYRHLTLAHRNAYRILKKHYPGLRIGLPMQLADMQPLSGVSSRLMCAIQGYAWNWWFLNRIRAQLDFIGLNYYFTQYIDAGGRIRNPKQPVSDLGWYMEPSGIGRLLKTIWQRYKLPIIITENGVADAQDVYRQWWLEETLTALADAQAAGVDLRGYLHWSLLDNFEWAFGWWPKFGLVAVDRHTMRRSVRPSARWFGAYIARARRLHKDKNAV